MARQERHRINEDIDAATVRLINTDELQGKHGDIRDGVVSASDALRIAGELGLDLVEISDKTDPPACRIVSYVKFREEQQKRRETVRAKQNKPELKEIRFSPNADEHDFLFKLRHAENFLQDGYKLKAFIHFRGSEIEKKSGRELLSRFAEKIKHCGRVEAPPKMEGRRMIMIVAPLD